MSLSMNAIEALSEQETSEIFLVTAAIFVDTICSLRIVNNTENIISNGFTYEAFGFNFVLPGTSDSGIKSASFVIDNVDRRILEVVTSAIGHQITAEFNIILASTPNSIERGPLKFCLRNIQADKQTVRADLFDFYLMDLNIPGLQYTPKNFPGLF